MATITLLKQKGGCGASTIAVNLAGELHARGRKVSVLDVDPQHSAAVWAGFADAENGGGCLQEIVQAVDTDNPAAVRALLKKAQATADVVIVDAPGGFHRHALRAASESDLILIPCGPSPLDLAPTGDALEVADYARKGRDVPAIALVPSKNLPRTRLGKELPEALADLAKPCGARVLPGISQRVAVAESVLCGLTVREYEGDSDSAKEFSALADAVEGLI
jgi:chromosome partitioning protein